ncbi:hypothetical protein EDM57_11170 [Brevibacillus gelatini]|uniref:Uncharacterized protein n=1 Tax=Brevibacillus gelatini TaxID=1655277 RepID=A0A3M8B0C5_9BACL|nr:DUF5701 family protein [Brevibacillus gelatini]RNB56878.1 hypothetical protein EDM57_11170 [Brevibacillus gelatini]
MFETEFDRQVATLVAKGYPDMLNLTETDFRKYVEPLKEKAAALATGGREATEGYAPFVLVVKSEWVDCGRAIQLVERQQKAGFSVMDDEDLRRFQPIAGIELPAGMVYLLFDIDTGRQTLNVTPNDALPRLLEQGRSPLTVEEGIALITHFPDLLRKNNGFSLLGSRCGDRRVTALWISQGKPKLGWCWAGNPHTWLGSASCQGRVGID